MPLHNNFTTPHLLLLSALQAALNLQYDPYRSCDMSTGAALHTEPTDGHRTLRCCLISHGMTDMTWRRCGMGNRACGKRNYCCALWRREYCKNVTLQMV